MLTLIQSSSLKKRWSFSYAVEDWGDVCSSDLYAVEDWGVEADYSEIEQGGNARVISTPIHAPEDWAKITPNDPSQGALGRELRYFALLHKTLGDTVPIVATIFSPLTTLKHLYPDFIDHLQRVPEAVTRALEAITITTIDFVTAALDAGCAGVFFAVQDANDSIGEALYRKWGKPYDLAVLGAAQAGWFNILHIHGRNILFDLVADYPVQVLNWHIGETAPSVAEYRAAGGDKIVLGGIPRAHIRQAHTTDIHNDIENALKPDRDGVIVSTGCVVQHPYKLSVLQDIASFLQRY